MERPEEKGRLLRGGCEGKDVKGRLWRDQK